MEKFPKFLIVDGNLIISKVTYHKEILLNELDPITDKDKIKGGGWFNFNSETNTFTLNGESHDFGPAKLEDIQKAIDNGSVYTNIYQTHSIANKYNFDYLNETGERINLKTL